MKKIYGLIGYPLGHSFSAAYFSEKFQTEGICAEYRNFPMPTVDNLRSFVEETPQLVGFNVTIPHKQAVIPLLDGLSDAAREIGAVNVVKVLRDGKSVRLRGYNTDYIGFRDSLCPLLGKKVRKALVLGTGGASRAVAYALRSMGIEFRFVSRNRRDEILSYDDIDASMLHDFPLIVNCTPLGMYPEISHAPSIPYDELSERNILFDLVYNPEETKFLRLGNMKGTTTKNGLEMLYLQAEEAWKIWTSENQNNN